MRVLTTCKTLRRATPNEGGFPEITGHLGRGLITEMAEEENFAGLGRINRELVGRVEALDSAQRVVLDMDSTEIPVWQSARRRGLGREEMLLPEIELQQKTGKEVVFRADAAFAKPEMYRALEKRGVQ